MKYDVVVAGGGTAGCAAAYTAGKLGLKTLLIEKRIHLGGTMTSGLVVPAMDAGKNQINTDFYNALIKRMRAMGGQITYQDNPGWFNPELLKIALDEMMLEADVEVKFEAEILSVYNDQIQIKQGILSEPIYAIDVNFKYLIDATGDCEISKLCGATFLPETQTQPVNLRFMMGGVDVETFGKWLLDFDPDRNTTTVEGSHLSTAYTWDTDRDWALAPLFDDAVAKNILKDEDRNYFQVFTVAGMPGTVAFNAPRLLESPPPPPLTRGANVLMAARVAILHLSNFCKEYLPGFENAFISNIADMLGVRVSRRIKGKYVYTIDDLRSGKTFDNPVLISNYPVDVHSSERGKSTLEHVQEYQLPVESLMSADVENLFVAGRCVSADFMAQGALRIQPNCFAMGEGVAKYIYGLTTSERNAKIEKKEE